MKTPTKNDLDPSVVQRLLTYDPDTGAFRWSTDPENGKKAGKEVGTVAANGYVMIRLRSKIRLAHRLAWVCAYGVWPDHSIDHINHNRHDNRLSNLRDVPHRANMRNHYKRAMLVGAHPAGNGRWDAAVHRYGTVEHLGEFDTCADANAAWEEARKSVIDPDKPKPRVRLIAGLKKAPR